ncbi:NAD(P)/FAD-dependent oxidoreductase [Streptomyces formicae]|uniref:Sarcosine oxidase alpha subunit n=1 Tax=Streptomyces formicae TaxID=1616117 RepID=A0A291QLI4_9ACTN|nr:FAD-dependent oxidoreductase [Streptomyces formicae]ATL32323.1 Sarcosine oxidase alpha subunit [Streptomyces formicae]
MVDVLVVGAGPAGLAAAAVLAALGAGEVEVLDREPRAGGTPRHCHHGGFGPLGLEGPGFAERWVRTAERSGAALRTGVTVTDWAGPLTLDTTSPHGLERITARAVVLATGARERPRAARLVPGTRPAGVLTTGELLRAVHVHRQHVGTRAVVVGAESVGFAALDALRLAGVDVAALVTEHPRHQTSPARALDARLRRGVPLLTGATVADILGRGRVSGVRLTHRDGRTAHVPCDTVVFTGDFVPEHELARRGGLLLDPGTKGPATDGAFRTDRRGVFAVGNLLHAVEPARAVAREGAAAGAAVRRYLAEGDWPSASASVPLRVAAPLAWIAPNLVTPDEPLPYGGRFALRTAEFVGRAPLVITQDGRTLHHARLPRPPVPNRPFHIGGDWAARVRADGGPVRIAFG